MLNCNLTYPTGKTILLIQASVTAWDFFKSLNGLSHPLPIDLWQNSIIWDKVFNNWPGKIFGWQPLKNLKGYGLLNPKTAGGRVNHPPVLFRKMSSKVLKRGWKPVFCDFWYYRMSHLSSKFYWNSSIFSIFWQFLVTKKLMMSGL